MTDNCYTGQHPRVNIFTTPVITSCQQSWSSYDLIYALCVISQHLIFFKAIMWTLLLSSFISLTDAEIRLFFCEQLVSFWQISSAPALSAPSAGDSQCNRSSDTQFPTGRKGSLAAHTIHTNVKLMTENLWQHKTGFWTVAACAKLCFNLSRLLTRTLLVCFGQDCHHPSSSCSDSHQRTPTCAAEHRYGAHLPLVSITTREAWFASQMERSWQN